MRVLISLKSKIKYAIMKTFILIHEHTSFVHDKSIRYVYLPARHTSKTLIVTFSAFNEKGVRGRYNYLRTLRPYNEYNRLFILDDAGYLNVGTYYMGENLSYLENNIVTDFIHKFIQEKEISSTVFVGSSKGGSCALCYGLIMNANYIICGSPQYFISQYLQQNEYHKEILKAMTNNDKLKEKLVDSYIENLIKKGDNGCTKIFLLFSSAEPSYLHDVSLLIQDIQQANIQCEFVDAKYPDHSDIGKFFPQFLAKTLKNVTVTAQTT